MRALPNAPSKDTGLAALRRRVDGEAAPVIARVGALEVRLFVTASVGDVHPPGAHRGSDDLARLRSLAAHLGS